MASSPNGRYARTIRVDDLSLHRLRLDILQSLQVIQEFTVWDVRSGVSRDFVQLPSKGGEVDGAPCTDSDRPSELSEKRHVSFVLKRV